MEKVDSVALELIPFCAKILRKSDAKVLVGDDVACLPHNPSHPTYFQKSFHIVSVPI
jgi:hypothetical protein